MQVFGKQSSARTLPLARKGEVYFSEDIKSGSKEHKTVSPAAAAPNTRPQRKQVR